MKASVALAAALFAVYAAGAARTIYVGDSGELVTAVHVLGIPHPSGYPLYVLLGKLWTLAVPLGSIALRMSLFSAACAASACGTLHWLCRRLGLHPIAAVTAALLLASAPSFWGEANVQRVYALGALFVVGATAAALEWRRSRQARPLLLAFFLCGLGATNHTFMAIYGLALAAFAFSALRSPRLGSRAALAFALGLLPYLYLPFRSRADPPLDWGNPEALGAFLDVVLRRDFWPRAFLESPADLLPIALDYGRSLFAESLVAGAALAVVGIAVGRRRGWPVLLPLLVMAANLMALALHGSRTDLVVWHRYYIPSYAMLALLAGMGAHALVERLPRAARLLPLVVPAALLLLGWRTFDRSRYRIAEDFSRRLLAGLPPGAHLAASDDNVLFVLLYLHHVEEVRPDVDLIPQGVGQAEIPPLRFDPTGDPLFFTHHPNWSLPEIAVVPVGLVLQVTRAGAPIPPEPKLPDALDGEHDPRVPQDYLTQNLVGQFHFMKGLNREARGDWAGAARELRAAAGAAPENDVLFYNLGLVYERRGLLEEALAAFRRSDAINPRPIPGGRGALASLRAAEVEREIARVRGHEPP